ncbi:MAG: Smr/MutS family protein [Rhodospirillales bacterium]|nr:Smr/MutS family protein [Rhodospirillales bacterium]MBN8897228.1 Smr/MutS family protein [Rhodospirillales bacterium]
MPPRARPLSEADRAAWAAYAGRITPLKGRTPVAPAAPAEPQAPSPAVLPPRPRPEPAAARPPPRPLSVGEHPGGVDNGTWSRFRTGKMGPIRKLDLHGQTTQRAYAALVAFLRSAHADQVRCVEVVTGRGTREGGGAIRRELPIWLNLPELRPLILAATHPHAANPGAVRLLLRRTR